MNTTKLKDALVELQQQKAIIDRAIASIQNALAMLDTSQGGSEAGVRRRATASYIDQVVHVLEQVGQPLHINAICARIAVAQGQEPLPRASIESSLARHIRGLQDRSRIVRVRPSTYALPSWPRLEIQDLTALKEAS